jgi:hypothetical protein
LDNRQHQDDDDEEDYEDGEDGADDSNDHSTDGAPPTSAGTAWSNPDPELDQTPEEVEKQREIQHSYEVGTSRCK